MKKRRSKYFNGVFDLKGDYRPGYCCILKFRIKDFLWRKWMNLFGATFVSSVGIAGMDSVGFWGNLKDIKVKFLKGDCLGSSYGREIQNQDGCLHEGMIYTIDYGDPVRLYDIVYIGKFNPHYSTICLSTDYHYHFKSGDCHISFAPLVGIRIISIEEIGHSTMFWM